MNCSSCNANLPEGVQFCTSCGAKQSDVPQQQQVHQHQQIRQQPPVGGAGQKSKTIALVLAFLIPYGIHSFYLGDSGKGIKQLLLSLFTCGLGGIWCWIEGFKLLGEDNPVDFKGNPLK